jgi:hypothetical protein
MSKVYAHQEYPKMVYHKEHQSKVVKDSEELKKCLSENWVESPAHLEAPVKVAEGLSEVSESSEEPKSRFKKMKSKE